MKKSSTFLERTPDEVMEAFIHRHEELQHSCETYDKGRTAEAPRLGLLTFLLVSDEGQRSLLTQVGKRDMKFMDSRRSPARGEEHLPRRGLQLANVVASTEEWGFEPNLNLNGLPTMVSRKKWLSRIVLSDEEGRDYTTKDVYEFFRHKEGGGHYDPRVEEGFAKLLRDKKIGFKVTRNDDGTSIEPRVGPLHATMRQIAYELELSIGVSCSEIVNKKQHSWLAGLATMSRGRPGAS